MTHARHARTFLIIALVAAASSTTGRSQSAPQPRPPVIPSVDVQLPVPPIAVTIAGRRHLAYELHITNFRPSEITLTRVEALDADRRNHLADFREAEISARLGRPGAPPDLADKRVVAPGMRAVLYLWLALDDAVMTPARLQHRLELDVTRASRREHITVEASAVDVGRARPIELHPPVRGGPWVALYDPMLVGGHRTTIYTIDGRARIPARYAIDWIRLDADASHARGDRTQIANWHGYGNDVLAVADATVVHAADDIPEDPTIGKPPTPVLLENASGNFVGLDLGGGRYAFYEHLKHGSLKVKKGDRVKSGQVIASLGNSGSSSSGPHLHFHVADTESELGGEGLPYVFRRFEVIGAYPTIGAFDKGEPWKPASAGTGGPRTNELPAANTVITFRE